MIHDQQRFCWIVAYIDSAYIEKVEADLRRYPEYAEVTAYIPTIKILTKTFKKKGTFEEIPLLFNYGFFQVPRDVAIYQNFLEKMQQNIGCIYAWVKDTAKHVLNPDLFLVGEFNEEDKTIKRVLALTDYHIPIATATASEIAKLVKDSYDMTAHSADDLTRFKVGDSITLRAYPWEGIIAEIMEIDEKKRKVKVKIEIFNAAKTIELDFDNVFFSIYHGESYNDNISILTTLEESKLDKAAQKNR